MARQGVKGPEEPSLDSAEEVSLRVFLSAVRGLSGDAVLLVLGGVLWWACHYTLLWNPTIAQAYSLAGGYDLRFLATLAGTVVTLLIVACVSRRKSASELADTAAPFVAYALLSVLSLFLILSCAAGMAGLTLGLAGAVLSGVGNSLALVFYGELHARIARELGPLAFAIEMAGGLVLSVVFSLFSFAGGMVCASLSAIAAAMLLFLFGRRRGETSDKPVSAAPVRVDITLKQLLVLAALTGFTYGLMRTFSTGAASAGEPLLGLGFERLGSVLCVALLVAVFALQRRASLFDQCLLFAVPFVATGMLLVSLQGTSAAVAATVNTCGFACFFALSWYFAAIMADESQRRASPLSVTTCIASFLCVSQLFQLAGALVPEQFANVFSSVLMYLIFAATLFMFWRDRERVATTSDLGAFDGGGTDPGSRAPMDSAAREALWAGEYGFSAREVQIATLLVERTPYRQIAEGLGLSENTVKTHVRNIYKKAEVASREELLAKLNDSRASHPDDAASPENRE